MSLFKLRVISSAFAGILLCSGCSAEVRERAYAQILAVHTGTRVQGAVRYDEESAPAAATAKTPVLLLDALQSESGKSLYTGHLSMLLLSGGPYQAVADYTAGQWLSPECMVLYTAQNAANLLENSDADYEAMLRQAVSTGKLPPCNAASIFGEWHSGTGVAAIPYYKQEALSLALCAVDGRVTVLSQDACMGLALMADAWEHFSVPIAAEKSIAAVTVSNADMVLSLAEQEGQLQISLRCKTKCKAAAAEMGEDPQAAAEAAIGDLLAAAMHETLSNGADLCYLREAAIRDGITWAKTASREHWRDALQQAVYHIAVESEMQ